MNNYIELLTKDETDILCGIITGKEFKKLFISNETKFQKIQRGFRAKTLEEQRALWIAKTHVNEQFISIYINKILDNQLKKIQENIDKLIETGMEDDAALVTTLIDSPFVVDISLYFKLTGKTFDVNLIAKCYETLKNIKHEIKKNVEIAKDNEIAEKIKRLEDAKQEEINNIKADCKEQILQNKTEVDKRIKTLEAEQQLVIDKLEADYQKNINDIKAECQIKINGIEEEKVTLESSLANAQEQIKKIQGNNTTEEYGDLTQFDDTDNTILPVDGSKEIISLCIVKSNVDGQKFLIRCADLSYKGDYSIFYQNKSLQPAFSNRAKIFCSDVPLNEGDYGIWTWYATHNLRDYSKDYILCKYNTLIPIEIIKILRVSSLDELINCLKNGIEYKNRSRKVMFAFWSPKGQYTGILCNTKELTINNGRATLAEDCFVLPVYDFSANDIMRLNDIFFYKKAFAGIPSMLYRLKSKLDIAKSIILNSISWDTYQRKGFIRTEYKAFKDFIAAIPVDDITCKIEFACHCTNSDAKELLEKILNAIWQYIDSECVEDKILLSAISVNDELRERTKGLLRKDWETENEKMLADGQKKLDLLETKLKYADNKLSEVEDAYLKTKSKEEELDSILAEKRKLADDVEFAVTERIKKARQNVADFIANMAFVSGQTINTTTSESLVNVETSTCNTYQVSSLLDNLVDPELHHSWSDVINTLVIELTEAGVVEKYRSALAAFLCAAYIEKQPIMIVGPNAIDIAKVFCAVVVGNKYGMLCCDGDYSSQLIKEIGAKGENIVIVNNLITSGWMNRIPELCSRKDIFYIATHPYAEDIQVEPKSLYGFMLPLFTEFFVDEKATGKYYGGYFADGFEEYYPEKGVHKELKVLSKFNMSPLVRNRINSIVETMQGICPETTEEEEFLFAVLPTAYASLELNELRETIADPKNGIVISLALKRDLQYILGEL